jgi:class 3 adenylate cyclase
MKNQHAVILFADIVGYSAMMQSNQEKTVEQVRAARYLSGAGGDGAWRPGQTWRGPAN